MEHTYHGEALLLINCDADALSLFFFIFSPISCAGVNSA